MRNKPLMKSIFSIMGLIGSLLWCLTIFLREARASLPPFILGVMPNFGAFWTCIGLAFQFYPLIRKKELNPAKLPALCGVVLLAMLLSEWIHARFLGAAFDWLDLLASLVACLLVLMVFVLARKWENTQAKEGR